MTTLSKEDVEKLWWQSNQDIFIFTVLARADLVAENERLKLQLEAQTEEWRKAYDIGVTAKHQLVATHTALAAAEADNEQLREAATAVLFNELDKVHMHPCDMHNRELQAKLAAPLLTKLYHVIFQPRDDSALRRLLAEAKAGVYEECISIVKDFHNTSEYPGFAVCIESIYTLAEKAKEEAC